MIKLLSEDRDGRGWSLGTALATLAATACVVATYSQLSHTWDEGIHVEAGLELLQTGRYTIQTENPPLARLALAAIPYLRGARVAPRDPRPRGFSSDVFYRTPHYVRNLTEARLANLLFFLMCVLLTWVLASEAGDPRVSFLATAGVATMPPLVAHAGLATTDVAFVAAFLFVLVALRRLLVRRNMASGAMLGVAAGIAVATKFSTFVFLPPVALAVVVFCCRPSLESWKRAAANAYLWRVLVTMAVVAVCVTWGSYGFNVGRLADLPTLFGPYGVMPATGWQWSIRNWWIPGHEFVHGLLYLQEHAVSGHGSMLFEEFSRRGFWLYFPVLLLTKTSLPFLVFAGFGLWKLHQVRESDVGRWFIALAVGALGILLVAMTSPLNLGVRHILVIYPLVALAAAYGLVRWARDTSNRRSWILPGGLGCIALQLGLLMLSVPNQITYYNVLAGSDPAHVASDSDFDWGQGMLALERYVAVQPIPALYIQLTGTAQACRHALPPLKALPPYRVSGWIAISERLFRANRGVVRRNPCDKEYTMPVNPGWLDWLKPYTPVAIVGKTIRVYYIEPPK